MSDKAATTDEAVRIIHDDAVGEIADLIVERDRYRAALEEIVRLNDAVVADLAREALNGES